MKYSKNDENVSPPLAWSNPPAGTKSFALICDDPDAPSGTWTHWLIKNIPADTLSINEGGTIGVEVQNDFGITQYGGPSPPSGTHRYYFKLYALTVENMSATTKDDFYNEVEEYKIGMAQLMGTYSHA